MNSALHPSEVCNRPHISQIAECIQCSLSLHLWVNPAPFLQPSTFVAVTTVTTEEVLRVGLFISIEISPGGDYREKFEEVFTIYKTLEILREKFNAMVYVTDINRNWATGKTHIDSALQTLKKGLAAIFKMIVAALKVIAKVASMLLDVIKKIVKRMLTPVIEPIKDKIKEFAERVRDVVLTGFIAYILTISGDMAISHLKDGEEILKRTGEKLKEILQPMIILALATQAIIIAIELLTKTLSFGMSDIVILLISAMITAVITVGYVKKDYLLDEMFSYSLSDELPLTEIAELPSVLFKKALEHSKQFLQFLFDLFIGFTTKIKEVDINKRMKEWSEEHENTIDEIVLGAFFTFISVVGLILTLAIVCYGLEPFSSITYLLGLMGAVSSGLSVITISDPFLSLLSASIGIILSIGSIIFGWITPIPTPYKDIVKWPSILGTILGLISIGYGIYKYRFFT